MAIRLRFFDTFRRDILKDESARGTKHIVEGNARAHEGDASTDAMIFYSGVKEDNGLMVEIYGMSAVEVLQLRKFLGK